jgi:hypothetical protein
LHDICNSPKREADAVAVAHIFWRNSGNCFIQTFISLSVKAMIAVFHLLNGSILIEYFFNCKYVSSTLSLFIHAQLVGCKPHFFLCFQGIAPRSVTAIVITTDMIKDIIHLFGKLFCRLVSAPLYASTIAVLHMTGQGFSYLTCFFGAAARL